jgi:phage-related minor tail protein
MRKQAEFHHAETEKMKADSLAFSAFWANNLISVVEQSGNSFNNIAKMFSNMIKKMMIQASVMGAINWLTGGVGGFVGGFKASLQGRASGGPISANTPYLVGERGPEIIMPKTAGTVIPNSAITHDNSRWELHFHDTATERKGMTLDDDTVFAEKFKRCVRDRRIEIRKLA